MEGCREGGVIGGDRRVVRGAELFQMVRETNQVLAQGFLLFKEEFGGGDREVLGAIPMEDLGVGTTEKKVISNNHFWCDKVKEGVDGEVDDGKGVVVIQITPLKVVIGTSEEGGEGIPLTDGREGVIVGLVN